jgi:hypothetical protein
MIGTQGFRAREAAANYKRRERRLVSDEVRAVRFANLHGMVAAPSVAEVAKVAEKVVPKTTVVEKPADEVAAAEKAADETAADGAAGDAADKQGKGKGKKK